MGAATDFLFFAEDVGAANFVASLPGRLSARGRTCVVAATGAAARLLTARNIPLVPLTAQQDEQVIARWQPRAVVVGTSSNPDTRGLKWITAARGAGVTAVGAVDAAMNPDLRFRGREAHALAHVPDWILVPDDGIRDDFLRLGAPADRVLALGHPHYDVIGELRRAWRWRSRAYWRQRLFPGVCARRKIVVFVSEGARRLQRETGGSGLCGGHNRGRTERALEAVLDGVAAIHPRPYFVLRIHPRDKPGDFAAYRRHVDWISSREPALECVLPADLVVSMTSQLLTEAALLRRPTLAVIPSREETRWLPGARSGVTPVATTRSELRTRLRALLARDCRPTAPAIRRVAEPGARDRVCDFLESLLSR